VGVVDELAERLQVRSLDELVSGHILGDLVWISLDS
jgi:hypothetical protein